jgi:predicted nucleic acid-binding protein
MGPSFVLDTSVTIAFGLSDESSVYAENVLESLEHDMAIVPLIWAREVGNVILKAERLKRISRADGHLFLDLLRDLPILMETEPLHVLLGEIVSLARQEQLSTYDAAYLHLAMRSGLSLATEDQALQAAAKRCGVGLYLYD